MMSNNLFLSAGIFLLISFAQSTEALFAADYKHRCQFSSIRKTNYSPYYGHRFVVQRNTSSTHKMAVGNAEEYALNTLLPTVFIVLSAAVIGVLIQTFINTMLRGDEGLSAYLSDGNGFNKSKFKPPGKKRKESDPLPWLKLPKLDFVEVAGQTGNEEEMELLIVKRLESLSAKMSEEINADERDKAVSTMNELNELMNEHGFEYKADVPQNSRN